MARSIVDWLPRSAAGNRLYWTLYFIYAHRRWPQPGRRLFNDYLYSLKASGNLASPLRIRTSDKIMVKEYVAGKLGDGFCPETLAVLEDVDQLRSLQLDQPHVIKPTHASGYVLFREDPSRALTEAELQSMREGLRYDLYRSSREINYYDLPKRLLVEAAIYTSSAIRDYKVFCYGGEPRLIQVDYDRHQRHSRTIYTAQWEPLPIRFAKPKGPVEERPPLFERMIEISRALAADFASVRVDFYLTEDRVLVGELTHCPEQGHGRFGSLGEEQYFSDIYFG